MNKTPLFTRKKADTITEGIFLILLGFLVYTNQWWPGILFAIAASLAARQFLMGRRLNFFFAIVLAVGLIFIALASNLLSTLIPFFLIVVGLFLVAKEFLLFKNKVEDVPY